MIAFEIATLHGAILSAFPQGWVSPSRYTSRHFFFAGSARSVCNRVTRSESQRSAKKSRGYCFNCRGATYGGHAPRKEGMTMSKLDHKSAREEIAELKRERDEARTALVVIGKIIEDLEAEEIYEVEALEKIESVLAVMEESDG